MPWGFAAAAVGTIGSAVLQADAAKDAAGTQRGAADAASQVQREMFGTIMGQQQPFIQSGYGANAALSRLLGITPQTAAGQIPGQRDPQAAFENPFSVGQVPTLDTRRYNEDPAYRYAWDQTLEHEKRTRSGSWRGHETYWHPASAEDVNRLGGNMTRFMEEYQSRNPGTDSNSGMRLNPNGSVQQGFAVGPTGGGTTGALSATGAPAGVGDQTGLPTGFLTQLFGPQQFLAGMDPGYQWRVQQGAQGVMNTAAAGSGALSGPALKALMEYNQGAASQEYGAAFDRFQTQQGNIFQRLSSMANLGQNAAAGVGAQGVATAGNIGSNIIGAGNAGAAGQIGGANAWGGALGDLSSLGMLYGMNQMKTS